MVRPSGQERHKLRLVLGVGRSGTSWVSRVLAACGAPMRCMSEPLYHIRPALQLGQHRDHTAIGYERELRPGHRLLRAYHLLTERTAFCHEIGLTPFILRDDESWRTCLIKEVHGLLATEALLRGLRRPAVLLVRDPVYVADSILSVNGLDNWYLAGESQSVLAPAFLGRFIPERTVDMRRAAAAAATWRGARGAAARLTLTVGLINRMFTSLAIGYPVAMLVEYERLCDDPHALFPAIATFLNLTWDAAAADFLESTTHASAPDAADPYAVVRQTESQTARRWHVLADADAQTCRQLLIDAGLQRTVPPQPLPQASRVAS